MYGKVPQVFVLDGSSWKVLPRLIFSGGTSKMHSCSQLQLLYVTSV